MTAEAAADAAALQLILPGALLLPAAAAAAAAAGGLFRGDCCSLQHRITHTTTEPNWPTTMTSTHCRAGTTGCSDNTRSHPAFVKGVSTLLQLRGSAGVTAAGVDLNDTTT